MSSPTSCSRQEEKQDLQNLNDRLNLSLKRKAVTTHETSSPTEKKTRYEHELSDARKLDETMVIEDHHGKPEIDTKCLRDNEDLKSKLEKKTKDLQRVERNLMIYEKRCSDLRLQIKQGEADNECKKLAEKNRDSEKETSRLKALLEDAWKHLEEETLQRIDLKYDIQFLKEDISFKDQELREHLEDMKRQVEIYEIGKRLAERMADLEEKLVRMKGEIVRRRLEEYQDVMDI